MTTKKPVLSVHVADWRDTRISVLQDQLQRIADLLAPLEERIRMARDLAELALQYIDAKPEDADDDI